MFSQRTFTILAVLLIAINVVLGAWFIFHGEIIYGFGGDIGRDMYLLELGVVKKFVLIGPHSGGIPGVYHGPAWMYLNLPAFILGKGNPLAVGWFWVVLSLLALCINYVVARKLFNGKVALLSTLLYSVFLIEKMKELTNPFGAVLLFPLFFYCIHHYLTQTKVRYLVLGLLLAGLIIQFQVAFGGPILLLTAFLVLCKIGKTKKWGHLLSFFILLIPFSTYIVFEFRHDFLQSRALYNYITGTENFAKQPLTIILASRIRGFFNEGFYLFRHVPFAVSICIMAILGYAMYAKRAKLTHLSVYKLFLYYYCGYWLLLFFYRGIVFDHYNWPFLPIVVTVFVSLYPYMHRALFVSLFLLVYCFTFVAGYKTTLGMAPQYIGKDSGAWSVNRRLAEDVFNGGEKEFGYYIYTPDLYATGTKYAFYYVQKNTKSKRGFLNAKKRTTYLIYTPVFKGFEFHNGTYWKQAQVKIEGKPVWTKWYKSGFKVEKYVLSDADLAVTSNNEVLDTFDLK